MASAARHGATVLFGSQVFTRDFRSPRTNVSSVGAAAGARLPMPLRIRVTSHQRASGSSSPALASIAEGPGRVSPVASRVLLACSGDQQTRFGHARNAVGQSHSYVPRHKCPMS